MSMLILSQTHYALLLGPVTLISMLILSRTRYALLLGPLPYLYANSKSDTLCSITSASDSCNNAKIGHALLLEPTTLIFMFNKRKIIIESIDSDLYTK